MTVWELSSILSKSLIYMGMLAGIGGMLVIWISQGQQSATQVIARHYMLPATLAGLFATCLFFLLQTGSVNQRGMAGMFDPVMASILLETEVGSALRWRLSGFLLALMALIPLHLPGFPFQHTLPRRVSVTLMLAAALSFSVAVATQGHASAVSLFAQCLAALHFLAIACWTGALYPLYLLVTRPASTGATAEEAAATTDPARYSAAYLGAVLYRFGVYSWVTLAFMLLTGFVLIWQLTGGLPAIPGNAHGQLLLIKIVLVAAMMGLGALHKFRWVPHLRALADAGADTFAACRRLARSIRLEIVLAVVVLILTASLTTVTGPAS